MEFIAGVLIGCGIYTMLLIKSSKVRDAILGKVIAKDAKLR